MLLHAARSVDRVLSGAAQLAAAGSLRAVVSDRNAWEFKLGAMKLRIHSKQSQYDRFEQVRTLRPNVTSKVGEFCPILLIIFHQTNVHWERLCVSLDCPVR